MADGAAAETTEDAALGGRLNLRQPRRGHRFGHDAILLAASVPAGPGDHVVDLGAGVGTAGLAVAVRLPGIRLTLVDSNPDLAALAAANAAANGIAATALVLDVAGPPEGFAAAGLTPGSAGHVLMNPPFNDARRFNASPERGRAAAHAASPDTLAVWTRAAAMLLAPGGSLTLIWRAEELLDVLVALGRHFGAIAVMPVHPRPDAAAIRIIVTATSGSRAPLTLVPGLLLNGADGRPAAAAEAILRGGGPTGLATRPHAAR